jgi:hypothetical protein
MDWADASEGAKIAITQRKSRIRVMPAPNTRRVAMVKCSVWVHDQAVNLPRRNNPARFLRYAIAVIPHGPQDQTRADMQSVTE